MRCFANSLYNNWDESVKAENLIDSLLMVEVKELLNWFAYVNRSEKKEVCYHTFHSTKGLEYENVVIILGKDFGVDRGLFETFLKSMAKTMKSCLQNILRDGIYYMLQLQEQLKIYLFYILMK